MHRTEVVDKDKTKPSTSSSIWFDAAVTVPAPESQCSTDVGTSGSEEEFDDGWTDCLPIIPKDNGKE